MLTVRLSRHGTRNRPFYHIVACDSRKPRDGRFIEKLGYYDPAPEKSVMVVNTERLQHFFGNGATLSPALRTIVKKQNIKLERNKQPIKTKK